MVSMDRKNRQIDAEILIQIIDNGKIAVLEIDSRVGDKVQRVGGIVKAVLAKQANNSKLGLARGVVLVKEVASLTRINHFFKKKVEKDRAEQSPLWIRRQCRAPP